VATRQNKKPPQTSYEVLTATLRNEIVSGNLPAGTRLTIEEIADRYTVSTMPVRQALQRLQGEGIVDLLPRKGARVLPLDQSLVSNIYDLRGAIEALLSRTSLPNITISAMERLDRLHKEFAAAVDAKDSVRAFAINADFHRLIYSHAGNPMAMEIYDRYAGLLGALRSKYGTTQKLLRDRVQRVSDSLAALHARDAVRLGQLAAEHCELSKGELLKLMDRENEL
jgi:DNA-binding GntR family transcriptional regulator